MSAPSDLPTTTARSASPAPTTSSSPAGRAWNPRYLLAYLKSDYGLEAIVRNSSGAVRKRLYFTGLAEIDLPIPSLAEQRALIDRLADTGEKLAAVGAANPSADELARLRQSILEEATDVYQRDMPFHEQHAEVLNGPRVHYGSSKEDQEKAALHRGYKHDLCRLGLLQERFQVDGRTKELSYRKSGNYAVPELAGYEITGLGRLLLKSIDMLPDELDL